MEIVGSKEERHPRLPNSHGQGGSGNRGKAAEICCRTTAGPWNRTQYGREVWCGYLQHCFRLGQGRSAASTVSVGSAPAQLISAVGPYVAGTVLSSNRRYTVNWIRWWALWRMR